MDWVKLVKRNNWGDIFYTLPGAGINSRGCSDTKASIYLEGKTLHVKFPDGTIGRKEIIMVPYYDTISDHGHSYKVKTSKAYILVKVHGIAQQIEINEVLVDRQEIEKLNKNVKIK